MPSADTARGRVRLATEHVHVLGRLVRDAPVDEDLAPYRDELAAAGLLDADSAPPAFLRELVTALASPAVAITVETTGPDGPVGHGAVVTGPSRAFTSAGWPNDPETEYAPIRPTLLPAELARMVAFHPAEALDTGPWQLTAPLHLVEGALAGLSHIQGAYGWDAARAAFADASGEILTDAFRDDNGYGSTDGDTQAPEAAPADGDDGVGSDRVRLAEVLGHIELTWRITVVRPDPGSPDGYDMRGVTVLDCGPLGYWRRDLPAEPLGTDEIDPRTPVRLTNVSGRELWNDVAALLPAGQR